jgi:hypothetical protein
MAQIDRPLLSTEHPNRWFECEKAIGASIQRYRQKWSVSRGDIRLVRDAVAVGWTDHEVQRTMWSLKPFQDEVEPGKDS